MKKNLVQVYVRGINVKNNKNFRIVELGELHGNRSMQIVIGSFEAEYIAAAMDNKMFKSPMPYDVISEIFKTYHINLQGIVIFVVRNKVFYAKLILKRGDSFEEIVVRISDAIALAMQMKVAIFVEKEVVDNFFTTFNNKIDQYISGNIPLSDMSIEMLQQNMKDAVEEEDYERAAEIRDEIKKREKDERRKVKGE